MFWPDVIELKSFYATPAGMIACQQIRRQVAALWPDAPMETVLGLGYATPYLLPYLDKADITIACMPATQGVVHWPQTRANLSVLCEETELPFATGTVNRLMLIHALENTEQVRLMLQEARRVLTPSGRLLVVAPNRAGSWVRLSGSPFSNGQPYSYWQLRRLLDECKFTPLEHRTALYFPPKSSRFLLRSARFLDSIGQKLFPGLCGVHIMEAEKQVYATGSKVPAKSAPRYAAIELAGSR
jgi:SAM-dependent methyltransferase